MANGAKPPDLILNVRDAAKTLSLATGKVHRIEVRRFKGNVLDVEDVHFHFDSAVLLPDFGDCGAGATNVDPADENRVTGLAAIRSVYLHAEENPAQKLPNLIGLAGGAATMTVSDVFASSNGPARGSRGAVPARVQAALASRADLDPEGQLQRCLTDSGPSRGRT